MHRHKGKNSGLCLATFVPFIIGREKYKYVRELHNSRATSDSSPMAGQVLLPAFECIAAQLDLAPATSGKESQVLAFDLKLPTTGNIDDTVGYMAAD